MSKVAESGLKRFLTEIPRYVAIAEATSQEEFKEYVIDEIRSLMDSPAVSIEDITGVPVPSQADAQKSRNRSVLNKCVNLVETSKNVTKVTGGISYLGAGGADVLFNVDAGDYFGMTKFSHDAKVVDFKDKPGVKVADQFFSFGASLKEYANLYAVPVNDAVAAAKAAKAAKEAADPV